jgi:transposase
MAMNNDKLPSFGKSDKEIANIFGMSASDFKKVKKQIISDMKKTTPKVATKSPPRPPAKLTPKATTKPMTEAQKQAKALDALQAKRAAVAKKTGVRPNYRTN